VRFNQSLLGGNIDVAVGVGGIGVMPGLVGGVGGKNLDPSAVGHRLGDIRVGDDD